MTFVPPDAQREVKKICNKTMIFVTLPWSVDNIAPDTNRNQLGYIRLGVLEAFKRCTFPVNLRVEPSSVCVPEVYQVTLLIEI